MSETTGTETAVEAEEQLPYLIGVRLRIPLQAEDHLTDQEDLAVGDFVVVETGQGSAVGEIRRPKRPLPEFKRGRLYRQVIRRATHSEVAEWRAGSPPGPAVPGVLQARTLEWVAMSSSNA